MAVRVLNSEYLMYMYQQPSGWDQIAFLKPLIRTAGRQFLATSTTNQG